MTSVGGWRRQDPCGAIRSRQFSFHKYDQLICSVDRNINRKERFFKDKIKTGVHDKVKHASYEMDRTTEKGQARHNLVKSSSMEFN